MTVHETYAKWLAHKEGSLPPDVYKYDTVPKLLMQQLVSFTREQPWLTVRRVEMYFNSCRTNVSANIGIEALRVFRMEHPQWVTENDFYKVLVALGDDPAALLSLLQCWLYCAEEHGLNTTKGRVYPFKRSHFYKMATSPTPSKVEEWAEELTVRFRQAGFGFAWLFDDDASGVARFKVLRVDSSLLHLTAQLPAIRLLNRVGMLGPEQEFLKAHEDYRTGDYEDCISECCKAFESTIKTILEHEGWEYDANRDTASKLVGHLKNNGFLDDLGVDVVQTRVAELLTNSVATLRNKNSGHGQGAQIRDVDEVLARFVLNNTGAAIVYLLDRSNL